MSFRVVLCRVVSSRFFLSARIAAIMLLLSFCGAIPTRAAILSWSGGGGANANWNNSANWGFAGTPGNGDTLIFPASQPNLLNTNNIGGLVLNQIRFVGTSGGYDIRGNSFSLTNSSGIEATNTAGLNTVENNIAFTTAPTNTIDVGAGATLYLQGALSGSVAVEKSGTGTLRFLGTGNNVYTGSTTVNAGLLELFKTGGGITAIPGDLIISGTVRHIAGTEIADSAAVTINSGALLDLNGSSDVIGSSLTLNGNAAITTGAGTLTLSPNATVTANLSTLFVGNASISGKLNVGSGACTFAVNPPFFIPASLAIPAVVSGTATINKTGTGFMSLSSANTFSGQVNILDGTLGVSDSLSLGTTGGSTTVSNSATLQISASFTNETLTIASSGTGLINASGANVWSCPNITLAAATTLEIDGTSLDLQATIIGSGGFTKTGAGTLTLSSTADNAYTGATVVNSGLLQLNSLNHAIGNSSALIIGDGVGGADTDVVRYINSNGNQIFAGIPITINSSGLFDLNGHSDDVGPITFSGGGDASTGLGTLQLASGGISVINSSNTATISGNMQIYNGAVISIVEGTAFRTLLIPANVGEYVNPSGFSIVCANNLGRFVQLQGSNSFNGPLTIDGLTVSAETPWALGSTNGATTVTDSGELFLYSTGITNETVTLTGNSTLTAQYDVTWNGPVILNGNSTINGFTSPGLFDIIGPISGSGNLISTAGATNRFSGSKANTYLGTTMVGSGTLVLNKSVSDGAIPGNVIVSNGAALRLTRTEQINDSADMFLNSGGLFDTSTSFELIDTLRGTGSITLGLNGWIEVGLNNGSSTYGGVISGPAYSLGGYSLAKKGNGTFTINGNNTFANGAVHIFAGTLVHNGSQPRVPILIDPGSSLGGSGTVGDISANGTIAPGTSPGTLTSSNVAFGITGVFTVELNGPTPGTGYDQLNVRGTNNLATATLTVIPNFATTPTIGQTFTIINNDGAEAITGTFNGLPNGSQFNAGGYFFRINYDGGTGNDVVLTLLGVPNQTVTLNAVDRGWYDSNGDHTSGNDNYFAGYSDVLDIVLRNWMVFNAPVSANSIISAELIINSYTNNSPQGAETYVLRKVTNTIPVLEAGGSGLTNIFNDLNDGAVYGIRTIGTNEAGEKVIIPLNIAFINDITAAGGGQIALGGSISTLGPTNNHDEQLFSYSFGVASDIQLRLTYGNSILLNSTNRGWYDAVGSHDANNPNYFAGIDEFDFGDTNILRNFFVFNLPAFGGQLVNAQLLASAFTAVSPSNVVTYTLYDVTNSITALTNSQSTATNIFADLGSGNVYGGRDVFVSESNLKLGIPLDNSFMGAAQANSGGQIALGGAITSLKAGSTTEYLFAFSGSSIASDVQLWLGFLSSPAASPSWANNTPAYLGNNRFQLSLSGTTGTSNEIQASFDFQNWDFIRDVAMSGPTTSFFYTNNTVMPYRFFRARLLP
jgi:autotransporter-associated beta strand protein